MAARSALCAARAASRMRSSASAASDWPSDCCSEGVAPGDRVAYLSFNTNQLLEGYFGAPLIRAIVMPLNVRLTPRNSPRILNHAEPQRADLRERFRAHRRAVARRLPRRRALDRSRATRTKSCSRAAASRGPTYSPSTKPRSRSCSTPPDLPARPRA